MDDGLELKEVIEGCTSFYSLTKEVATKDMPVFYNPRMRGNRDLSILIILYLLSSDSRKRRLAFPMTATGIREMRLLCEHKDFFDNYPKDCMIEFLVNDINARSLELAKKNIKKAGSNISIRYVRSDARSFMIDNRHYDYVEIDPFGTPIPYIDIALQSLKDNSIIGVTATDTSALTGTYPKATLRKYGCHIILSPAMHEISVRILSSHIIRRAASLGLGAQVLFSYSDQHYVKAFFRVRKGKGKADSALRALKNVLLCGNCGMLYDAQQECTFCNTNNSMIGPLYMGGLWDDDALRFMSLKVGEGNDCEFSDNLKKKMMMIGDENRIMKKQSIRADIHRISSALKLEAVPKMEHVRRILADNNNAFSRSIFGETIIRTDSSPEELTRMLQYNMG